MTTVRLSVRELAYELPSYSLTSDLLGYLRCGLQYRYHRLGALPSSRPVQLWFGQFIHGVLEEGFRRYDAGRTRVPPVALPFSDAEIEEVISQIKRRLAARGLVPWSPELEDLGDRRARAALAELAPVLYPMIHRAEVRITGARQLRLDLIPEEDRFREADRYEMVGVVDVVTHVELERYDLRGNPLVEAIVAALPERPGGPFEVIIDYKGMRRPPKGGGGQLDLWQVYGWQVNTYAHLRSKQADSHPVAAGVILYLNELVPTTEDLKLLKEETASGTTDIPPTTAVAALLDAWRPGRPIPDLPLDFRVARALRVLPISPQSIAQATAAFDEVVAKIERCRGREQRTGRIISSWEQIVEESTCTACDARTFCPSYTGEVSPRLPSTGT